MMDEDEYGIPNDYYQYSGETPQHYPEQILTSFDEFVDETQDETLAEGAFGDFGEYMRVT